MFCLIIFICFLLNHLQNVISSDTNLEDEFNSLYKKSPYKGEKFHAAYLAPDKVLPTVSDLKYYLKNVNLVVNYFNKTPNMTDVNVAMGMFLAKALLKRTIIDDGIKLKSNGIYSYVKKIISNAENIVTHFIYNNNTPYGWKDLRFRFSKIFKSDKAQVYSVKRFSRNTIRKWIYSNIKLHDFIEEMDQATYPKENYVKLVTTMGRYYKEADSDKCISKISFNPEPINMELTKCNPDPYCKKRVFAPTSVAYALSHRLAYIIWVQQLKRCYVVSARVDVMHIDLMCSNMFREAVYIARRGFFSRDLFLEHIALCGLFGYEEFHRRQWFYKAASWIDEDGCMQEDRNFEINRTKLYIDAETNPKKSKEMKKMRQNLLADECHSHPMMLLVAVLSHGVRHAAHFMLN